MILVLDPRTNQRARLTGLLDGLGVPYKVMGSPSQALTELQTSEPFALIVAPQLGNLSGSGMAGLAHALRPRLETLIVDQPEQDRGLVENLARRLKSKLS